MKKHFIDFRTDSFWQIDVSPDSVTVTSGRNATMGKTSIIHFSGNKNCLKQARVLIREINEMGYHEASQGFCHQPIPTFLQKVLDERETISINMASRKLILLPKSEILVTTVAIKNACSGEEEMDGLYCTVAYVLGYEPGKGDGQAICLIWLPQQKVLGAWRSGAGQLVLFFDTPWTQILDNPFSYLDLVFEKDSLAVTQNALIKNGFVFIPANLDKQVNKILKSADPVRRVSVQRFLDRYESKLLCLPFCQELETPFNSLVTLYYRIGQWLEGDSNYSKAIGWFEKSQRILNQSSSLRQTFVDIYLQLSFCYLETSRFDSALLYIDLFAQLDDKSREACARIKESIIRTQQLYKNTMSSFLRDMEATSGNGNEEAVALINSTIASAPHDPILHFNLACYYSASNRLTDSLYHLEEAFKKGYQNHDKLNHDVDLENVRNTSEFEDVLLKYLFVTRH
jgi:predicted DNA-binding WGR domain protein/tetratricopeptide (TPR) repeat protein